MPYAFVSYSRHDASIVTPIVLLLRAAIAGVPSASGQPWDLVFQDTDSIAPGASWREKLLKAIESSERMFVFWCKHSAASEEVLSEYRTAQYLAKTIVPVLIDNSPLSEGLSHLQGVDLRALSLHRGPIRSPDSKPSVQTQGYEVFIEQFSVALDLPIDAMRARLPERRFNYVRD